jgi:hypothetical protein
MSHIVAIQTQVRDPATVGLACQRLKLLPPVQGTAKLFAGEAKGLILQFPGWRYPVVIDTTSGTVQYDAFGGRWGDEQHLHRFLQIYLTERTKLEAHKHGYSVQEQVLDNGSIKLEVVTEG